MKKAFLVAVLWMFAQPVLATHSLEEFSPGVPREQTYGPNGENFYFFNVIGDGDCGFYAMETTREAVLADVTKYLDETQTLSWLQFEALNLYVDQPEKQSKIERYFGRTEAEAFLANRYSNKSGFLDVIPDGHGLIDFIAHKHKNLNINIWQWNYKQDPTRGVKYVRTITVDPTARTIDIVVGGGHFSRLVKIGDQWEDKNAQHAIEHEKLWKNKRGILTGFNNTTNDKRSRDGIDEPLGAKRGRIDTTAGFDNGFTDYSATPFEDFDLCDQGVTYSLDVDSPVATPSSGNPFASAARGLFSAIGAQSTTDFQDDELQRAIAMSLQEQ